MAYVIVPARLPEHHEELMAKTSRGIHTGHFLASLLLRHQNVFLSKPDHI